jgi:predicted SnoaL-like aldol condensation-catalyzing enzyme
MKTKLLPLFAIIVLFYGCQKNTNSSQNSNPKTTSTIQDNKKTVLDFYQKMFGDKDISAVDQYIAPEYIQHNPNVADGSEAFKKAAVKWFEGKPKTKIDVQHIAAEGDLVFLHIKNTRPDGGLKSTIDIFRLKDGKIVEHWDVHQDVPEHSANNHPMF